MIHQPTIHKILTSYRQPLHLFVWFQHSPSARRRKTARHAALLPPMPPAHCRVNASLTLCSTHSVQPTPLQFSSHCGARGTAMPTDQNQLVSLPSAPGRPNHLDFPLAHSCPIFCCYLGMEIQTISAETQRTITKIVL